MLMVDLRPAPGEMILTSSNYWSVPLVDMMVVSKMIGFNRGRVMRKNCRTGEAPSILAAS